MKTINEHQSIAKNLPTHIDGILQPQNILKVEGVRYYTLYGNDDTPAAIFEAVSGKQARRSAQGYYVIEIPTKRDNGTIKPKNEWEKVLMFHKKWSRKDVVVTSVSYDVVGYKRKTTQLPSGVLIANIDFKI